jgi:hypothetical protein
MIDALDGLLSNATGQAAKQGFDLIVGWLARGLAFLIEWFWKTIETSTTPRLTDGWFANELFEQVALLALGITVALMLASAIQGALSGRPEQIWQAVKQAAWSIAATGLAIAVMTELMHVVDEASNALWAGARGELRAVLDGVVLVMQGSALGALGFLGVVIQLVMYLGLMGLGISMGMRGTLIYLVAALCPLVFSSSVLPMFRESSRKIIHVGIALIGSKLAVVIALVVTVKLLGNSLNFPLTGDVQADAASAFGAMMTAATMFVIASLMPIVLYKLMPTIEGAVVASGISGSWGRAAMTGMYAGNGLRSLGSGNRGQSAANRPIPAAAGGGGASSGATVGAASAGAGSAAAGATPAAVPLAAMKAAKAVGNRASSVATDTADGATTEAGSGGAGGAGGGDGGGGSGGGGARPGLRASSPPASAQDGDAPAAAAGAGGGSRPNGATPAMGRPPRATARRHEDAVFDDLVDKGWLGPKDGSDY